MKITEGRLFGQQRILSGCRAGCSAPRPTDLCGSLNPDGTSTESERLRPGRQLRKPARVFGMFGDDILEVRVDQHVDVGQQHRGRYRRRPNRVSSSSASTDLGRSRSAPGRTRTPDVVINLNGGGSDGTRCFSASSKTVEMNALTLNFWAAAARRTWFERSSLSDIVILMVWSITWS